MVHGAVAVDSAWLGLHRAVLEAWLKVYIYEFDTSIHCTLHPYIQHMRDGDGDK